MRKNAKAVGIKMKRLICLGSRYCRHLFLDFSLLCWVLVLTKDVIQ